MISISDSARKSLSNKHIKLLEQLIDKPAPKTIKWDLVESMIKKAGGIVSNANGGSGVMAALNDCVARLHKPHGRDKVLLDYQVKEIIGFLRDAGLLKGK